jgi:hypothetical protein
MDKDDEKKQRIIDYNEVFGTPNGKRVLAHLKKLAHYNVAFVPRGNDGHLDPYEMCREEGKRAVIVHIEMIMNKDPYEKKGITNERRNDASG